MARVALILVGFLTFAATFQAQINVGRKVPILNGMAKVIPRPEYPADARLNCIGGRVEVEVNIDAEGKVASAKAVSGEEPLREASAAAAMKARFYMRQPVKLRGFLIYNFDPYLPRRCTIIRQADSSPVQTRYSAPLPIGDLNQKAKLLPMPRVTAKR